MNPDPFNRVEVLRRRESSGRTRLPGLGAIAVGLLIAATCTGSASAGEEGSIDRRALVARHRIVLTNADPLTPISVGNGRFAFTADITGLQTFPRFHESGMPLSTLSDWGWHSFPNPENFRIEDVLVPYDSHGRTVHYLDGPVGEEGAADRSPRARAANRWLRANPHRLDLARIGFQLTKGDATPARLTELTRVRQTLDLWTGILESRFWLEGTPVRVQTICHPETDQLAVRVESALLTNAQVTIRIAFPYAAGDWMKAAEWTQPDRHRTLLAERERHAEFKRVLDETTYFVSLQRSEGFEWVRTGPHAFQLSARSDAPAILELVAAFEPVSSASPLPAFEAVRTASARHWRRFWERGGAIDLSASTDPRWRELERRIVLSQYLTAINSAGSMPPQETGLVANSWFGKPHLEMHWWHAAHFALWGRESLLERSLGWYRDILPAARELARSQGYQGARWPKMTDPSGAQTPSSIAVFLIWQQPHPIFYAELLRRANPGRDTLTRYRDLVFESAEFMADFAFWDEETHRYVLGPPVIPAQESYGADRARMFNPTYELAYWQWALQVAQTWREALDLPRVEAWDHVADNLSRPTIRGGVYAAVEPPPYTVPNDHPSMLCALGVLPKTDLIEEDIMRATLDHVWQVWDWPSTWGWDYPVIAMTAARVGEPERAIDALFLDTPKNRYLANGHNYQRPNLPLYLPGNGGLLYAVGLMAAGWDGAPDKPAPGFPDNGKWVVRQENIRRAP